jgi:hypothetical protein
MMTASDLIAVAPWIVFGVVLSVLCIRLRTSKRR